MSNLNVKCPHCGYIFTTENNEKVYVTEVPENIYIEADAEEIRSLGELTGDTETAAKFIAEKRSLD